MLIGREFSAFSPLCTINTKLTHELYRQRLRSEALNILEFISFSLISWSWIGGGYERLQLALGICPDGCASLDERHHAFLHIISR